MSKNDIVMMEIDAIIVDESFNSRVQYDGTGEDGGTIESLARDIKRKGLLQPPVVREDLDGKVHLVAGFRRLRALRINGEKLTPVTHLGRMGEQEALIANITENVQRLTLKPAELAIGLHRLSESGMSGAAIASQVGLSKPHVNNLIRIRKSATPYIWQKWSAESLTMNEVLAAIAGGTTEDEQRVALERHLGAKNPSSVSEDAGEDAGDVEPSNNSAVPAASDRPKRRELEEYEQACRDILAGKLDFPRNKGLTEDALIVVRDVLSWVNGNRKKPPFTMPKVATVDVADEE